MATKSEKAHDTRLFKAARCMAQRIAEVPLPATDEAVASAVLSTPGSLSILQEAFLLLDREPSRFVAHANWHPKLRRLRNNPEALALTNLFQN